MAQILKKVLFKNLKTLTSFNYPELNLSYSLEHEKNEYCFCHKFNMGKFLPLLTKSGRFFYEIYEEYNIF